MCDRKGHIARECPNRKQPTRQKGDREMIACTVSDKKDRLGNRSDSNMNVFVETHLGKDATVIRHRMFHSGYTEIVSTGEWPDRRVGQLCYFR